MTCDGFLLEVLPLFSLHPLLQADRLESCVNHFSPPIPSTGEVGFTKLCGKRLEDEHGTGDGPEFFVNRRREPDASLLAALRHFRSDVQATVPQVGSCRRCKFVDAATDEALRFQK